LISYQGVDGGTGWINENVYDPEGRFLKSVSSTAGEPYHEVEYSYDDKGRVERYISKTHNGLTTSICSYDADSNKTVTTNFEPKVLEAIRGGGSAQPPISSIQAGFGVPDGGTVCIRYDQGNRPLEAQVLTIDRQLVSRVLLTYDLTGRLLEEKQIIDSPEFMFTAKVIARMLLAGGRLDQLREQLRKFTGGEDGQHVASYVYDVQGRVIEQRTRIAPFMERRVSMT
jgi:hypothetical protein